VNLKTISRTVIHVCLVVILLAVFVGCSGPKKHDPKTDKNSETFEKNIQHDQEKENNGPVKSSAPFNDGEWTIEKSDIQPGIYISPIKSISQPTGEDRNSQPTGEDRKCSWEITVSNGSKDGAAPANEVVIGSTTGQAIIRIDYSVVKFKSANCGEWIPLDQFNLRNNENNIKNNTVTSFSDGYWLTTNIEPGVYRTRSEDSRCRWGTLSAITPRMNDYKLWSVNYQASATITTDDEVFFTEKCGIWNKVGEVGEPQPTWEDFIKESPAKSLK